ncbi:P-loop containing nucleoside triphosphate hydrolase protein, partial [Piedraia hortae CBS 480.64]
GFPRGKVSEVWGPSGAGKTAICLQIAALALKRGSSVIWASSESPFVMGRLNQVLKSHSIDRETTLNKNFHWLPQPTLSHQLAFVLHSKASVIPRNTSLLIFEGVHGLIEQEYPRYPILTGSEDMRRWKISRRYAVLNSLVSGLNKLATVTNTAVVVTTGCASRARPGGLGPAIVPGVGGREWDSGIFNRLVLFRDHKGRFIGLTKCRARSLVPGDGVGAVGKAFCFEFPDDGVVMRERRIGNVQMTAPVPSPKRARKRFYDEVADSEGEEEEELYGWDEDYAVLLAGE